MNRFRAVSLKQKIFLGYAVLILLPLCVVTAVSSRRSVMTIEKKAEQQLGLTCDAINDQYDTFINDIEVISQDIVADTFVQETLRRSEEILNDEQYISHELLVQLEAYLLGIRARKPGIHSILIYGANTQNFSVSAEESWDSSYDATKEPWFTQAGEAGGRLILTGVREERQLFAYGIPVQKVITMARLIKDMKTFQPLGIVQINLDLDYLAQLGSEFTNSGSISVLDGAGVPIVFHEPEPDVLPIERTSERSGWTTVFYASKEELFKETQNTRFFLWMVAAVTTALGLVFAKILSNGITRPIQKLHEQMAIVSKGDFSHRIQYDIKDEMGELIDEFNEMTNKVCQLVREIHEQEDLRRKIEIDALQAQINPHFIYNTLNVIRLTAMLHKDQEITQQLTDFVYLLKMSARNDGKPMPIGEVLKIVTSYCSLMKYRYNNFSFKIDGGDEVADYLILPFTIQPLVENAIFHGIAALKREGSVYISFKKCGNFIHAAISDDGMGMDTTNIQKLLAGEDCPSNTLNHVGLKNVRDRLKLYFGCLADMKINSEPGRGTVIHLQWPAVTQETYCER